MGRLSVGQVREWDPARMQDVASSLQHSRSALVSLAADLPAGAGPTVWQGPAASAAYVREESLAAAERAMVSAVAAVQHAVDDAADRVRAVQAALDQVQRIAAVHRLRVDDDNQVRDAGCLPTPADAGQAAAVQRDRERAREAARASVHEVLRAAVDVDDGLASMLFAAARDGIGSPGAATLDEAWRAGTALPGIRLPAPPSAGPYDAATWWRALTPAEREEAARTMPDVVGGLDGLPSAVRDEANRTVMARERQHLLRLLPGLQATVDRAVSGLPGHGDAEVVAHALRVRAAQRELASATTALAAIAALITMLAQDGPRRQLLSFGAGGRRVTAAVSVGDVDTAGHVAVFVPGLTSQVQDPGTFIAYDAQMAALVATAAAMAAGPDAEVAAVTWLDYEAPQWDELFDPGHSVLLQLDAHRAGPVLASFVTGIDAAREQVPHLTLLGHSYGSTTVGYALQRGTGVDDAVVFGSPGLGTSDVADLQLPPGHAWLLEARGDPVADLGAFGADPSALDGIVRLSSDAVPLPGGVLGRESRGHSSYLAVGSTAAWNIAAVVAGRRAATVERTRDAAGERVRRPEPPGPRPEPGPATGLWAVTRHVGVR
jgi:Alpha/beta hydrolase